MNSDTFEARMRALEYFHSLRVLPGAWIVIRVDGHGFSRLTATGFEKPFDLRFHDLMTRTARALLEGLGALYAYTESDEISVLLPRAWELFSREVEKIVSLSAGLASATFTHAAGTPAHFDSRLWLGVDEEQVVDYFRWRQADAARCALNGWCYWTLRGAGRSTAEATRALEHQSVGFKNELLFQQGINFNNLPAWQRRGTGLYWESYRKEGFNPQTGQQVWAERRRVKVEESLPLGENYDRFVRDRMVGRQDGSHLGG